MTMRTDIFTRTSYSGAQLAPVPAYALGPVANAAANNAPDSLDITLNVNGANPLPVFHWINTTGPAASTLHAAP